MSDFDEGLAAGLAIGRKKWRNSGGETEAKWKYPEEWLPLPTPEENEIYILVMHSKNAGTDEKYIHTRSNFVHGDGLTVDWGDGYIYDYNYGDGNYSESRHSYTWGNGTQLSDNIEMYLIKVSVRGTLKYNSFYDYGDDGVGSAAIAIGGGAVDYDTNHFVLSQTLQYIRFTGDPTNWERRNGSGFNSKYGLARVDFDFSRKVRKLPPSTFNSNQSLTDVNMPDLSEVTECGNDCFAGMYGLKKISLPELQLARDGCFIGNYGIRELNLPSLKTVGSADSTISSFLNFFYNLRELSLPSLEIIYGSQYGSCFNSCYALEKLDLPKLTAYGFNADKVGSGGCCLRTLNAPNADTTGWFKDSVYMY